MQKLSNSSCNVMLIQKENEMHVAAVVKLNYYEKIIEYCILVNYKQHNTFLLIHKIDRCYGTVSIKKVYYAKSM